MTTAFTTSDHARGEKLTSRNFVLVMRGFAGTAWALMQVPLTKSETAFLPCWVPRLDELSSRRRRLAGTIDGGADLPIWFTGGLNESDY